MPTTPDQNGSVLQHAIRLYRASIGRCWPLALIGAGLLAGAGLYWAAHTPSVTLMPTVPLDELDIDAAATDVHAWLASFFSPAALSVDLLMAVLALLFYSALTAQLHAIAVSAQRSSARQAFAVALSRLPGAIVACVGWLLVSAICLLVLLIPGNHTLLALLLLIPSVYASGRLQLWLPAMFVEERGAIAALRHSWAVMRSQWWRATSALTLALLIIGVLELFADGIVALAGAAAGVAQLLHLLANALLMPMLPAALLATYYQTARQAGKKNPAERGLNLST